ncbi:hypothetical protein F5B19DRAFT_484373 [Rostrohypoxylon terebratum]|nr:hypothetical protein F5B19DRAFT_484373 [Rostrohypoxylon terebratum]
MAVEVVMNTPLADALNVAIQPKLVEVGWGTGGAEDSALSEYIILMLVNGKTQEQIAAELASDLLGLDPNDPSAGDFAKWLFHEVESLNSQLNGGLAQSGNASGGVSQNAMPSAEQDADMTMSVDGPELNAPTGPRSMRNGGARGGREKRLLGQMAKAMDRSHDNVLHRVRANGNERINAHRAPPTGPRGGFGRGNTRMPNNRGPGFAAHLNQAVGNMSPQMHNAPPAMNGMPTDMSWMMPGAQDQLFQMLQQQNQIMQQMQQQLNQQSQNAGGRPHGRSLFDRVQSPRGNRRGGHANGNRSHQTDSGSSNGVTGDEDTDMGQARREPPNPEATVCKYNLLCTNKDCKFAHQSPAAPPNTTVDISDVCSYGAACKNRKCVGRHPSPATKRAHQIEQECKFYPNCANANCPFKHPDMPPCRNGGDCAVEGCKFTHLQTMCKYSPCTNRFCPYKHEEGQRGTFQDKVWTAGGSGAHVSERKFVDGNGMEELIVFIDLLRSAYSNARHGVRSTTTRPPTSRRLSSFVVRTTTRTPLIGCQWTLARTQKLPRTQAKTFATTGAKNGQREIAVLGGGITGLTAAHYLARHAKNAHITLYERSSRLGGWIHGETLQVGSGENDKVLFQRGPRMLRPYSNSVKCDDMVFYDLIVSLDLQDSLLLHNAKSNARYIYYPDHLVELPSMRPSKLFTTLGNIFNEPLYEGAIKSALNAVRCDFGFRLNSPSGLEPDDSIGQFFDQIFRDDRLTKNVLSALVHGIYGGDIYKLSVKYSIFDRVWRRSRLAKPRSEQAYVETKDWLMLLDMRHNPDIKEIELLLEQVKHVESMAFDDGLVTLVNALVKDLRQQKNVSIKTNCEITSLAYENKKVSIGSLRYDQVISTLFSKHLASLVRPAGCLPSLEETKAVTMMVVNMWFPNPCILENNHGFGYLIPTSTPNNRECLLGVLFDSDLQSQPDPIPGTKLTAMLGGHYWDGWKSLPSEEMAEAMAKEAVYRHLNIDPSEPVFTTAKLCRDCIPQQFVGHRKRMEKADKELMDNFQGRLSVAGPSYTGVGVLPAMRSGFDVAMAVATGHGPPWFEGTISWASKRDAPAPYNSPKDHVGMTGLKDPRHRNEVVWDRYRSRSST